MMSSFKIKEFFQIGIVVKDIEQAKKMYSALLEFEKDLKIFEQDTKVVYKGKEVNFKLKKIQQNWGGKQMEIVEVLESDGDHLYSDFLKEGKEGLHHLGVHVKEAESYIKHFKENFNIDIIQTGQIGKKVKFYYLDTLHSLGFYIELITF